MFQEHQVEYYAAIITTSVVIYDIARRIFGRRILGYLAKRNESARRDTVESIRSILVVALVARGSPVDAMLIISETTDLVVGGWFLRALTLVSMAITGIVLGGLTKPHHKLPPLFWLSLGIALAVFFIISAIYFGVTAERRMLWADRLRGALYLDRRLLNDFADQIRNIEKFNDVDPESVSAAKSEIERARQMQGAHWGGIALYLTRRRW